jgi:ribosome maturation protein SDO1
MVNVDEAFQVRYKHAGENFEVLVDFNKLNEFKSKPLEVPISDVLADDKIFRDQKKGDLASDTHLNSIFPNKSHEEIITEILIKGECQIPTAYLNELRETKKKQIINYIAENAMNPQTKSKYTSSMIDSEINKLNYNFHPDVDYMKQADEVLTILKKVMPIAIVKSILKLKVSPSHCSNFYGPFRKYGQISKEFYDDQGYLHIHMEINESISDEVINYIKNNSNNEAEYFIEHI